MGKFMKYLVITDDGETKFYDKAKTIAAEYNICLSRITDIISGVYKNIYKKENQANIVQILKVSLINYKCYSDRIIEAIEKYNLENECQYCKAPKEE
jgi:predicted DNA-binding ribbon-helix-helix protein